MPGGLSTDLYELNMVQAYLDRGEDKERRERTKSHG